MKNLEIIIPVKNWEIWSKAIRLRFSPKKIHQIKPQAKSMMGAGLIYKKRSYITHTTLHPAKSAIKTLYLWQKLTIYFLLLVLAGGFAANFLFTIQVLVGFLSAVYFIDVLFNLLLIFKSLHYPPEISTDQRMINLLKDEDLPVYTILCPLYREAKILPQFIDAVNKLDWPKDKLDVMLLLEEDDGETIKQAKKMGLPAFVRTLIVPDSLPKTKPKACNFGLTQARGEYLVIYDAEDIPEPLQLKKAYLGFQKSDSSIICLQSKLNYYNPNQNLLTKLFTAEYSLWFDVVLPGLQSIQTHIPLGGTSNHFRTKDLIKLEGWDPFNVTEDADLGMRIFRNGYKTAIIDSVTLEEANSNIKNWLRQRSRWIKGYMQTYFVHMRHPVAFVRENNIHALTFQLVIGARISFMLINPILWLTTISYFVLYPLIGHTIESFYPTPIFYMAVFSLIFGNFIYLYNYMIGCAKRGRWSLIKYVYLVPFYWLLTSTAAVIAFYQLIVRPHYWEKTIHGLHLGSEDKEAMAEAVIETEELGTGFVFPGILRERWAAVIASKKTYIGGITLIVASMAANFLNFVFNAYLGRVLEFKEFALIGLIGGFLSFASVLFGAFGTTANYRTGFLIGKYGVGAGYDFWRYIRKKAIYSSLILVAIWLLLTPMLMNFFDTDNIYLFLSFGVILLVGLIGGANRGFLSSNLEFSSLAVINIVDPFIKLAAVFILVLLGLKIWTFAAIPLSILVAFITGWILIVRKVRSSRYNAPSSEIRSFSKKFFLASILTGASTVGFLTIDVLLAKHYLTPTEAGKYALLSLIGKMVYFLGGLVSPFLVPLISRSEGAKENSTKTLYLILISTTILSLVGYLAFGLFGYITIPILFGEKAFSLIPYLYFFALGMVAYTISRVFINYYLIKKSYAFTLVNVLLIVLQIIVITLYHRSVNDIAVGMFFVWCIHLITTTILHLGTRYVKIFENNIADLFGLFVRLASPKPKANEKLRILIFNWRDTKHKWAGGAEVYIHELAKRWAKEGSSVTIFSGNDGRSARNDVIDGVQIYRRGGFYMVYLWAFLYYIFRFRGKYDVIIDSENGIPFFTPLFAGEKKFLLIHHVHQEVFLTDLKFPLAQIGKFLEGVVMPIVYRNTRVITVSESSKQAILELGFGKRSEISIVSPGVDLEKFATSLSKTRKPSLLYLGRLKPYKSIDRLIKIMKKIKREVPGVTLTIAGEGESRSYLEKLTRKMGLRSVVKFLGGVSEKTKVELFAKSWALVQPSRIEGWGITIIEANAAGTTVIASDVPGLRDSVQNPHTGLLVTWDNQEKWIDAITKVLKDRKFRGFLEENSRKWVTEFSWDKSSNKLMKLFKD